MFPVGSCPFEVWANSYHYFASRGHYMIGDLIAEREREKYHNNNIITNNRITTPFSVKQV